MPVPLLFDLKEPLFPGVLPGDAPVGAGPPVTAQIPFTMQSQEQSQWCWAAVSASVSRHYDAGSDWTQCKLADAAFNQTVCCQTGACNECNRPHPVGSGLQLTGNLDQFLPRSPAFDEVKAGVSSGNPLCSRVRWASGGGHAVVISGYMEENSARYVTIEDPFYGQATYELDEFLTNYNQAGGQCAAACLTKPA